MYSIHVSEAQILDLVGRKVKVMVGLDKLQSDKLTVGVTEVPPLSEMQPHTHDDKEEIIFILEGNGEVVIDGAREAFEPMTAIVFPQGKEHQVKNKSKSTLKFVFIFNGVNDFNIKK